MIILLLGILWICENKVMQKYAYMIVVTIGFGLC